MRDSILGIRIILYDISFQNFEIKILKNSRCEQTHSKQFRFKNQTQLVTCLRSSLEMTLPKRHSETVKIKPSGYYKKRSTRNISRHTTRTSKWVHSYYIDKVLYNMYLTHEYSSIGRIICYILYDSCDMTEFVFTVW